MKRGKSFSYSRHLSSTIIPEQESLGHRRMGRGRGYSNIYSCSALADSAAIPELWARCHALSQASLSLHGVYLTADCTYAYI